jgi:hypothetical protein
MAGVERGHDHVDVERCRHEHLDQVDVRSEKLLEIGEACGVRPVLGAGIEAFLIAIAQGDHLCVGVVAIRGEAQLGDLSEADDADAHRPVDGDVRGHGRSLLYGR